MVSPDGIEREVTRPYDTPAAARQAVVVFAMAAALERPPIEFYGRSLSDALPEGPGSVWGISHPHAL
jgi:hypothetical protein